ncbi:secreted protein [Penicillium atrosanguineum]|uniref:Secreted protein n=1 Tax=Penicillium atrosanguineum TaxID=1132637 RepID=A0A9W9GG24_9EURO|nr:exopolygalacturonase C [Penicillium atrosanguineum]KAJ5119790.1 secreted protein [Penicillium atrosanguineum]KAJ5296790.1 exopolygalacturonase C [Penicillium atrosanguineum]KAJ5299550.1 secreted protein [Penicillium atrosanguineum]
MKSTLVVSCLAVAASAAHVVNQTTCAGTTYKYTGLAGYGFIPANATDKYGDTIGGIGSSVAIDQSSWHKKNGAYHGTAWAIPDRGWNTNGTLNFQSRIHKIAVTLKLATHATLENPSDPNIQLEYLDTILLTGPDGEPTTGLDADITGYGSYKGFPPLPVATYTGNGFGGAGKGGRRISVDAEGLALARDGGFWVSDEYGPYIYKFSAKGKMELAIQPPQAYLPRRNETLSFNSDTPPLYDPSEVPNPEDTTTGRANNQGLEGLTISPDGKTLYALMQSALDQEGGPDKQTKQPARMLAYDISGKKPKYIHEWVVMLPKYFDYTSSHASKANKVAAQSEIHQLPSGDFLVLARDSGFGHGQDESLSVYRNADVFSVLSKKADATDLKAINDYDTATGSIASSEGVLDSGITPAEYCTFLDFNVNSELGKFRLHNGGAQDQWLLNEKWESLALVPAGGRKEYFLFSWSDNDFITQDGYMNFGKFPYKDASGYNLDNQVLAFKVEF